MELEEVSLIQKARKVMLSQLYLTLATVDQSSQPWVAPVYFNLDPDYNCYWVSEAISQHSLNLKNNHRVMATLFDSNVPHGQGFGVYLQGIATELQEEETIRKGIELLSSRINSHFKPTPDYFLPPKPRRIYKLTVLKIWVNTVQEVEGVKVDRKMDLTDCLKSS